MSIITTDPIADMFSRIRNAIAVSRSEISLPHSSAKATIAEILVSSGFLTSQRSEELDGYKSLKILINEEGQNPAITSISRLSRPGQRRYVKASEIPRVRRGRGIVIISTSEGVMTGDQAKLKNLGGELICEVF